MHVSTAYSNCPLSVIEEKFYEPQCDPRRMIELAERVDRKEFCEDTLITLTPKIIRPWPNTYSFTKALCEDMVKDYGEQLPIVVVRPSIGKLLCHVLSLSQLTFCFHSLNSRSNQRRPVSGLDGQPVRTEWDLDGVWLGSTARFAPEEGKYRGHCAR